MKIKKILSLFCSAALVATALSTGAIITKADEQQSETIKVDFSQYTQVDYDGKNTDSANMNYTAIWGYDCSNIKTNDDNHYLNFSNSVGGKNINPVASAATFLVDPSGTHGTTRLENNTTYNLTVKYRFNALDFSDMEETDTARLLPYITFKSEFSNECKNDRSITNPINGFWTKYGYYANTTNEASNNKILKGIGMGSMDTANGADVWKTYETSDGWTTGTLSFTTNDTVNDKDMYFGFISNYTLVINEKADKTYNSLNFDIDSIEITKASKDDADAYAYATTGKSNTYVDFSSYAGNHGSALTFIDSSSVTGATGNKVAKVNKSITNGWQANFRLSATNLVLNSTYNNRLTSGNTYELEVRYKFNSFKNSSKDIPIGALLTFGTSHYSGLSGKMLFGAGDNGISASNPTGNFWDEAVVDENDWVTAKLQFTAPDVADGTCDTYFTFADTENGLSTGTAIDMYIDYINVRLAAPVKINGVEKAAFGVPGETMTALAKDAKKENYETGSAKATATETTYYSDSARENIIDLATEKYGAENVLYSTYKTVVDTESQAIFCGFDEYKLRTNPGNLYNDDGRFNYSFYDGLTGAAGYNTKSFSITSEDSYTGTKSLLYNYKNASTGGTSNDDAYAKVAYIGNGYDLIPGKTYELSFWYKPAAGNGADTAEFMFTTGKTYLNYAQSTTYTSREVEGLTTQNEWKQVKLHWTCTVKNTHVGEGKKYTEADYSAPVLKLKTTDDQTAIYFDSFVISEVATYDGAAKLNTVDNDGKQAIRFKYSYDTVAGEDNTVKIAGEAFTVAERGILVKSANNSANLVRNTTANGVMKAVKTDKFNECWNYNAETGKYEFSMYIKGLDENDTRELVSRAYVVLKDSAGNETVFYSETSTTSVNSITEKIESETTAE